MSSSGKKLTAKKSQNSYSLLLKGFSDVEKSKPPQKPNPVKRSSTPESGDMSTSSKNNDYGDNPSTSHERQDENQDPDIPDRSYGDYYCKVCDSHMNSDGMWDAHVTGKRHIKNVKKGDSESKYDDLPDVESTVKYEIRNVKDPIVGLSYIHEIRRKEPNVPPIYNCFLCHASIATVPLVTEHVITLKHRLNYIKENNPDEYTLLEATNLKKGHMEPLVEEVARKMEQKFGRGTVKVKQEKKKDPVYTYSAKRYEDDSFKDKYQKPFNKNSREDSNDNVWKSVGAGNSFGRRDRSRSPREFDDRFMSPPRSRSPRDFREKQRRYSDERSMDDYKRSFSKRSISPPPRERSPKYDLNNFRSSVAYPHLSRKSDSHDRMDYISSRYEHTNQQESIKRTFDSRERQPSVYEHTNQQESIKRTFDSRECQPSVTFMPQDNYVSSNARSVVDNSIQSRNQSTQPKSFEAVYNDTFFLTSEDCYRLFYQRLKTLPEIRDINEMLCLTKVISEAQKKLKTVMSEEIVSALMHYQKPDTSSNVIPGLGESISSSAKSLNISNNSPKPVNATTFLSDLFKSANSALSKIPASQDKSSFAYSLPTSFASVISSQQSTLASTYQVPPTSYQVPPTSYQVQSSSYQAPSSSYQAPPANSYQDASTGSYPNHASYQLSNANVPFTSGSMQKFQHNMTGLNPADKASTDAQIFNYSHYSSTSTSSAPKNFPRHASDHMMV